MFIRGAWARLLDLEYANESREVADLRLNRAVRVVKSQNVNY